MSLSLSPHSFFACRDYTSTWPPFLQIPPNDPVGPLNRASHEWPTVAAVLTLQPHPHLLLLQVAASPTPEQGTRPPPPPRISPQYARGRIEYVYCERGADYAFTLATNSYAVPGTGSVYVRHVQSTFAMPMPDGERVRVRPARERPRHERDISPLSLTRPILDDEPPSNPAPRRHSPESSPCSPRSCRESDDGSCTGLSTLWDEHGAAVQPGTRTRGRNGCQSSRSHRSHRA